MSDASVTERWLDQHGMTRRDTSVWGEANRILDEFGIDQICGMIATGEKMVDIAKAIGVAQNVLGNWIYANHERATRARVAREASAQHWDEVAEQTLKDAKDGIDVQRARELASHYRWRASKIAPKVYGDKLDITADITVTHLSAALDSLKLAPVTIDQAPQDEPDDKR